MPTTKIIGLGSPHGDDQAGWKVIEAIEQTPVRADVELLQLDRPGPGLLNYLQDCEKVILIDACDAGWPVGTVRHFSLEQLLECAELQGQSSHQLGLAETLQLATTVNYPLPEIECYLIQLEDISPLTDVGLNVQGAVEKVLYKLRQN